jgi:hypothetical protein
VALLSSSNLLGYRYLFTLILSGRGCSYSGRSLTLFIARVIVTSVVINAIILLRFRRIRRNRLTAVLILLPLGAYVGVGFS